MRNDGQIRGNKQLKEGVCKRWIDVR